VKRISATSNVAAEFDSAPTIVSGQLGAKIGHCQHKAAHLLVGFFIRRKALLISSEARNKFSYFSSLSRKTSSLIGKIPLYTIL